MAGRPRPGPASQEVWGWVLADRKGRKQLPTQAPAGVDLGAHSEWAVLSLTTRLDGAWKLCPSRGGPTRVTPHPNPSRARTSTVPATPTQFPLCPFPAPGGPLPTPGAHLGLPHGKAPSPRLSSHTSLSPWPRRLHSSSARLQRETAVVPGPEEGVEEHGRGDCPHHYSWPLLPYNMSLMPIDIDVETEAQKGQVILQDLGRKPEAKLMVLPGCWKPEWRWE